MLRTSRIERKLVGEEETQVFVRVDYTQGEGEETTGSYAETFFGPEDFDAWPATAPMIQSAIVAWLGSVEGDTERTVMQGLIDRASAPREGTQTVEEAGIVIGE